MSIGPSAMEPGAQGIAKKPVTAMETKVAAAMDLLPRSACETLMKALGRKYKKTESATALKMEADFAVGGEDGVERGLAGDFLVLFNSGYMGVVSKELMASAFTPTRKGKKSG